MSEKIQEILAKSLVIIFLLKTNETMNFSKTVRDIYKEPFRLLKLCNHFALILKFQRNSYFVEKNND